MNVKIKQIKIKGFRSCTDTTIKLQEDLSVLIGVNGAGKTNILKAFLLLRDIILQSDRNEMMPLNKLRASYSEIRVEAVFQVDSNIAKLTASAFLGKKHRRRLTEEVVYAKQSWAINNKSILKSTNIGSLERVFLYENQDLSRIKYKIADLKRVTADQILGHESWSILSEIKSFVKDMTYYSASQFTDPSKASTFFEIEGGKPFIRTYGAEGQHDKILADMYTSSKENPSLFDNFLGLIGPDQMGLITNLQFEEYELPFSSIDISPAGSVKKIREKKIMVFPLFIIGKKKLAANQLSEGTFKTIALMFYLSTNVGQFLMIEEPEVCVHHGLLKKVLNFINSISNKKQLLVSTHSELFLDKINSEKVILVKNRKTKGTITKSLTEGISQRRLKAIKDYLENTGGLGELWRSGEFDV
jgi:predicted ATP-dependent endonuclease of OLD family